MRTQTRRTRSLTTAATAAAAAFVIAVGIVLATSYTNISGPSWNGTDWVLTGEVTYTGGDKTTCIRGTFTTSGGPATYGPIFCSSNTSPFTCTIPGPSVANATGAVTWLITTHTSNDSCGGSESNGPSGTFALNGTGPLAVRLDRLSAEAGARLPWPALLGLVGVVAGMTVFRRRR